MQELALTPLVFTSALAAQYIMDFIDRHVVGRNFDWKHNVDTAAPADLRTLAIEGPNRAHLRRMSVPRANTDVHAVYETIDGAYPDRSRDG